MNNIQIGIAAYTKDQWVMLRKYAADTGELDATYADWENNRDKTIATLRSQGCEPILIQIDVPELEAWCHARNKTNTASSRAEFCSEKLRKRSGQQGR